MEVPLDSCRTKPRPLEVTGSEAMANENLKRTKVETPTYFVLKVSAE